MSGGASPAESPDDARAMTWARWILVLALVAVLAALAALAYTGLAAAGESVIWPDKVSPDPFSAPWRPIVALTTAGLLIGAVHRLDANAGEVNVFDALAHGRIDRRAVPGGLLIALIGMVGGASLGPEVPTGMAAAGVAGLVAHRARLTAERSEMATTAAITGAFGGLFTAPLTATMLNVELAVGTKIVTWPRLAADGLAAVVGFAVFFAVESGWSTTIALLGLASYEFELWHLPVAVGLGVLGAVTATLFKLSMVVMQRLAEPFADRPVLRGGMAGLFLGLLGAALPLTLFLGTDGLLEVTKDPESVGIALILVSVLAKIVATTGALSFGFVGGPIFPLLFVGGSLGAVTHQIVPDIPAPLAITALMAAVPAAVIPAPLSISTLVLLMGGLAIGDSSPVFTAAVVAMLIGQLIQRRLEARTASRSAAAQPPPS